MCPEWTVWMYKVGALLMMSFMSDAKNNQTDINRAWDEVPDEQRLYERLMRTYEPSVRPVINSSKTVTITFKLTLNQIVELDERTQVLTTNVFIDQEWLDENLHWEIGQYNGIKTLRVPASYVWLPDTFIFNNADDGSTGFMQGIYVVVNANGTVTWPVPVKLKSSCKVDITFFPFDDQRCILRFGSWIHSGDWMDFDSSLDYVDLRHYIDNSEWELVGVRFEQGVRTYSCCPDPHPHLTYTLHIRRRTFYYVFNIIVPCVMLSILTLLTFWLPTTSGEKISLGLSVFLAFSMFMLLIAEEVPATSESVPLIGVYLTTVMTMTSVSVIMAVMVINLYNRGGKSRQAPEWMKWLVLVFLCKILRMKHDIDILSKSITLDAHEEARYKCHVHRGPKVSSRPGTPRPSPPMSPPGSNLSCTHLSVPNQNAPLPVFSFENFRAQPGPSRSTLAVPNHLASDDNCRPSTSKDVNPEVLNTLFENLNTLKSNGKYNKKQDDQYLGQEPDDEVQEDVDEPVWLRRGSFQEQSESLMKRQGKRMIENGVMQETVLDAPAARRNSFANMNTKRRPSRVLDLPPPVDTTSHGSSVYPCRKEEALAYRKLIVVEWQTMATVVDRLLFYIFLIATVAAYLIILLFIPYTTKPNYSEGFTPIRLLNGLRE